ncbi:MAG: DUF3850 domain-containing protein [Patescibacteria group bacterium]
MKIEKKIWPEYFQEIMDGKKKFDLRLGDFNVSEGDILVLREWDQKKKEYTGRSLEKEVKYILKTKETNFWPKEEVDKYGYQVIGF